MRRKNQKMIRCEECGLRQAEDVYRGRFLCRLCLCPPAEPVQVPTWVNSTLANPPASTVRGL